MSQASRRKALRPWRVRERVAIEIGRIGAWSLTPSRPVGARSSLRLLGRDTLINVHAAREHALGLVALADEQTAFEDWCRWPGEVASHKGGKGPENREPGAFTDHLDSLPVCEECSGGGSCELSDEMGVHEAWECPHCEGTGGVRGGWPGNLAREWARQGGDRRAPMGRSLARLGRAILDAIEGQPSECQECGGEGLDVDVEHWGHEHPEREHRHGWQLASSDTDGDGWKQLRWERPCEACQGTSHNLRGVLPPVEVSPQLRRKVADVRYGRDVDIDDADWCTRLEVHLDESVDGWDEFTHSPGGEVDWTVETRVTPRGEHRGRASYGELGRARLGAPRRSPEREAALDALVSARTWGRADLSHAPRWQRGELRHAQQRRERETRRALDNDVDQLERDYILTK